MTENDSEQSKNRHRRITALIVSGLLLSTAIIFVVPYDVAGQTAGNVPDYYDNESYSGAEEGWFGDGNATLDQILDMGTNIPTYIIGTGELDQSGTGYVGLLLSGVIMGGAALGAVMGAGTGPVGGTIVALTTGFGLVSIGFAPGWTRILMLFAIGALAALAIRRVLE